MIFEACHKSKSIGATLAHGAGNFKKGLVIAAEHLAGLPEIITIARLEAGDVDENLAAQMITGKILGEGVEVAIAHTGRVNLFANIAGLLVYDEENVHRLNEIDEAITLATLKPFSHVKAGEMIATLKIIPYAVSQNLVDQVLSFNINVMPFSLKSVALIQTTREGFEKVTNKTEKTLAKRLKKYNAEITSQHLVSHHELALSAMIKQVKADIIIIFGLSAISDRRDVIPESLVSLGGIVEHLGMPVDPGNLLMLGYLGDTPVIGAPGCARSIKHNGFDLVLDRLFVGLKVSSYDIKRMGVGGLIAEIESRPEPRDPK